MFAEVGDKPSSNELHFGLWRQSKVRERDTGAASSRCGTLPDK